MDQQLVNTIITASEGGAPPPPAGTPPPGKYPALGGRGGGGRGWGAGGGGAIINHLKSFGPGLLPALLLFLHSPFLFGYVSPCRSGLTPCAIHAGIWCWSRGPDLA